MWCAVSLYVARGVQNRDVGYEMKGMRCAVSLYVARGVQNRCVGYEMKGMWCALSWCGVRYVRYVVCSIVM